MFNHHQNLRIPAIRTLTATPTSVLLSIRCGSPVTSCAGLKPVTPCIVSPTHHLSSAFKPNPSDRPYSQAYRQSFPATVRLIIDDETLKIGIGEAPLAPAFAPTVDETGITVNGRKYGFQVRLVTEVK